MATTEEVEHLMKRCQIGVGGRNALETAHDIMAECYGTLGVLVQERGRCKLPEFRLFVRHGSDQKNSPQPTRARGKTHANAREGKRLFGRGLVAKHLGGFLDTQHAVQAIRLGPQCAKRYALDLELPRVWRVLAPLRNCTTRKPKRRCQSDIAAVVINCFLSFHAAILVS